MKQLLENKRILVVDDNPDIHKDFNKVLGAAADASSLDDRRARILGVRKPATARREMYQVDHALQGREGVDMVRRALAGGRPYALAFVDMRMPPGWNGLETIRRMWSEDPLVEVVVCTAFSDYSLEEISDVLGRTHRLLVLKKPFESMEVAQLASALTAKWSYGRGAALKMEELEGLVGERTAELKQTKEEAEKADRCKAAFLANISHELRTPMNGVKGMLELLLETPLTTEQKELGGLAHQSAMNELEVIDAILDYVKSQNEDAKPKSVLFDLRSNVNEAMEAWAARAEKKSLEFAVRFSENAPRILKGDPLLLRRVLINLVSNAIKFTRSGSVRVDINVERPLSESVRMRFAVTDTGVGVPPNRLEDIFESFIQVDGSFTRRHMGAGLGLAISRQLVSAAGGELGVQSREGEGSSFWFLLDFAPAPSISARVPVRAPAGL